MMKPTKFAVDSSVSATIHYLRNGMDPENKRVEDYYVHDGGAPSKFLGTAMKRFGVESPEFDSKTFERLFKGKDPDGKNLQVTRISKNRAPGFDLTFGAPKSVSVAHALGNEEVQRLIEYAESEAVSRALLYIEQNIGLVNSGTGKAVFGKRQDRTQTSAAREPGHLVAATFQHGTSRMLDPHRHVHAFVYNVAVRQSDGKVMALNSKELFDRQVEIGAVYRSVLASELQKAGFSIERDGDSFQISGIPRYIINLFSKRHEEILWHMAEQGTSGARASDVAALVTRAGKVHLGRQTLHRRWMEEAAVEGFYPEMVDALLSGIPAPKLQMMPTHDELLRELTDKNSTFTREDAMRQIAIEAQGILDERGIEQYAEAFFRDAQNLIPLENVYCERAYTSRDLLHIERALIHDARDLQERSGHPVPEAAVDLAIIAFEAEHGFSLSRDQRRAIDAMTLGHDIALVQGGAGTGKTTALKAAKLAFESAGLELRGSSLQKKAASGLQKETDIESDTIDYLLGQLTPQPDGKGGMRPAAAPLKPNQVLVVDEAGMVGSRKLHQLISLVKEAGAKLVLVGDIKQLNPVEAGNPFYELQRAGHPVTFVTKIQRQRDKALWQREAVKHAAAGEAGAALKMFHDRDRLHIESDRRSAFLKLLDRWEEVFEPDKAHATLVLGNTRAEVALLNRSIRSRMEEAGRLGASARFEIQDGEAQSLGEHEFAVGDRVQFLKNHRKLGLENSAFGTITAMQPDGDDWRISVKTDPPGGEVQFKLSEYDRFMHGYAATTYKSQGATLDNTLVLAGGGMQDFHSTYVQISRNRYSCDLFVCKESVEAQMQGCHATQRMIEAAARLGFEDPEEATFREIRDFLNVHLYHIEEGQPLTHEDWMRDIQNLIKRMETTRIKPSTLDWSPVRQADRESVPVLPETFDFDFDPLASEKLGSSDDPTIEASREDRRRGPR